MPLSTSSIVPNTHTHIYTITPTFTWELKRGIFRHADEQEFEKKSRYKENS